MERRHCIIRKTRVSGIAIIGVMMLFAFGCEAKFSFDFDDDFHGSSETIEEVLIVGEMPILIIKSENGGIEVEAGELNEVEVKAELRRPDDVEFTVVQEGDTITITAKTREGFFGFQGSPGADIEVTTPPNTKVDLRTSNGSIELEGIQEPGSLRTSNGNIVLDNVKGAFEARTSNGSIKFEGELIPGGNNELRTSNGSVSVELMGNSPSLRLDATTSNGSVVNSLPITASSIDDNHISGTIGNGEAKLVVRTSNGSVTIR